MRQTTIETQITGIKTPSSKDNDIQTQTEGICCGSVTLCSKTI